MSKQLSLFLKMFLPLLVIVAVVHVTIFYVAGRRRDDAEQKKIHKTPPGTVNGAVPGETALPPVAAQPRPVVPEVVQMPEQRRFPAYDFSNSSPLPQNIQRMSHRGKSGIIVDLDSRRVIWAKEPLKAVPIASLTKLMTALLVMEDMHSTARFDFTTRVPVTAAATSVERSCVLGMKSGEYYPVEELIAAMMINSHNDAAAQLAAMIASNVPDFVALMNRRARELGMDSARFNSPNGLPQGKKRENSLCSVYDVTRLCERLLQYPELLKFCRMRNKKLHTGRVVYSHNNLLTGRRKQPPVPGLIGFKTGFTNRAGFCLAFGVERDGKRIIGCVTGFPSANDRDNFCRRLIEWAFSTKR